MKAAVITSPGLAPVYADFKEPAVSDGFELVSVRASALSPFSKSRSSGAHYSSDGVFPCIAGADGVGLAADGHRVYFALPQAPFGSLAERSLVHARQCVPIPDALDDITAAAIANPGMSAWAALVERASLQPGETVLINGATGTAGRLAVQLAKYLGASTVIATARNEAELQQLRAVGADVVIPFALGAEHPHGAEQYEQALIAAFARGIDVVVDYLWGTTARTIIVAIAKAIDDARPVRFVHVGGASGEEEVALPGAALRSSAIQLMGSGVKSIPFPRLLHAIQQVFSIVGTADLKIAVSPMPLASIDEAWNAPAKPRIVITLP